MAESSTVEEMDIYSTEASKWAFNLDQDDWKTYIERLELYFVANDIGINKRVAVLLTKVNADTYTLIRDLCAAAKPKDKSFDEIVKLVQDELTKHQKPSKTMERFRFNRAKQTPNETISEYVTRLKKLSLHCNFLNLENALRDQLVCGLRDRDSIIELFQEKELTLDIAIRIATTRESAVQNFMNMHKMSNRSENSAEVNLHLHTSENEEDNNPFNDYSKGTSSSIKQNFAADNHEKAGSSSEQQNEPENRQGRSIGCFCCGAESTNIGRRCKRGQETCSNRSSQGHIDTASKHKKRKSETGVREGNLEEDSSELVPIAENEDSKTSTESENQHSIDMRTDLELHAAAMSEKASGSRVEEEYLRNPPEFVNYTCASKTNSEDTQEIVQEYRSCKMIKSELFKECLISLNNMDKVFCSQWLSDSQVIFGTKCNKLMAYNVKTETLDQIPLLHRHQRNTAHTTVPDLQGGIHSIQMNPSRTLLSTGGRNNNEIAIYRLPTLDPVCVGENGHRDWVFDMCWLDDEFLVSGSRDTKMSLWRIDSDLADALDKADIQTYKIIQPVCVQECQSAQKVRALAFNKAYKEIAALSLNSYIHIWSAETFEQKMSRKLPACQETVCLAVRDDRVYAIGCRSCTLLLDPRTLQTIKKIPSRYGGCSIRSASFQGSLLTIGTELGILMFYDIRAQKYLESSINSNKIVSLKASKGYVFPVEEYVDGFQNVKYTPAIYTHCYDATGTRLFTAGGPLPANLYGNYAGLWKGAE